MHVPVLLNESLGILNIAEGDIYLDATLGGGGHAAEVWNRFGNKVVIAGIDADSQAVEIAKSRLSIEGAEPKFAVLNFRHIDNVPELLGIGKPNKILFDLGWNKMQFETGGDEVGRGFSFQHDEPLVMTFASESSDAAFTARTIVNEWGEESLQTIIEGYGEERFAKRIAKEIVEQRTVAPIETTFQLVEIIKKATPLWYHFKRIHPATRTFQALRITVNDELQTLKDSLEKALEILQPGGRIAVITFHSLEDRIVKRFFKEADDLGKANLLIKKPVVASEQEQSQNPRSRSAKLRAIEKQK